MTPEQFAYWFSGYVDMTPEPPTQEQWDFIRDKVVGMHELNDGVQLEEKISIEWPGNDARQSIERIRGLARAARDNIDIGCK